MFLCYGEDMITITESLQQNQTMSTQPSTSSWEEESPPKRADYYMCLRDEYSAFISGHELLAMPPVTEAGVARIISLLTADFKSRKIIAVSRDAMERHKALNIGP